MKNMQKFREFMKSRVYSTQGVLDGFLDYVDKEIVPAMRAHSGAVETPKFDDTAAICRIATLEEKLREAQGENERLCAENRHLRHYGTLHCMAKPEPLPDWVHPQTGDRWRNIWHNLH